MFANFEGYGAKVKKDSIFESADAAAYKLFKRFVGVNCQISISFLFTNSYIFFYSLVIFTLIF